MLLVFGLLGYAHAATTTVTGTINDLTGAAVTSGQVTFELKPGLDTTISGSARFVPSTVTCYLNGSGVIKGDVAFATSCTVVQNTSLTPNGTYYLVCLWPSNTKTSCFNWYALASSFDITTAVPTPATSPAFTFADLVSNQTIGGNKTASGSWTFTPEATFSGGLNTAYVKSQSTPSTTGFSRYGQGDALKFRNALNNADLNGLSMSSNVLALGDTAGISTTGPAAIGGSETVSGTFAATSTVKGSSFISQTANPASVGAVRLASADVLNFRNNANGADINGLSKNSSDVVQVGDAAGVKLVGPISTYNNIPVVSNGVPSEVATVDLTAQSAAVTTAILYAVPSTGAGQYRLSWDAKVTTAAGTSSTLGALTITYTDPDGVVVSGVTMPAWNGGSFVTTNTANTTGTILMGSSMLLNCKASTNITYAMGYASNAASAMQYNLHIKLEAQ